MRTYNTIWNNYVIGQLLQLIWVLLLPVINFVANNDSRHFIGVVATIILSTAFLISTIYFDDITALFQQRKTMTLANFSYGGLVGFLLFKDGITVLEVGVPELSLSVIVLFLFQTALLIYKFQLHLVNQNSLSEHYALVSTYSSYIEKFGTYILLSLFITSVVLNLMLNLSMLFTVSFLVPLAYLVMSLAMYNDPLSSTVVGQKIQAVALLSGGSTKYLHVFMSSGQSVLENNDFIQLMEGLDHLMAEISYSNTKIRSISSDDILVMVEPCGSDALVFVLQYRAPILGKVIRRLASKIVANQISSQEEFSALVESSLLKTRQNLRIIPKIDDTNVVVMNDNAYTN